MRWFMQDQVIGHSGDGAIERHYSEKGEKKGEEWLCRVKRAPEVTKSEKSGESGAFKKFNSVVYCAFFSA